MLRGVAAFAVLMSHLYAIESESVAAFGAGEQPLLAPFWENGFAGVDLFFVISGFIMVYVTAGRERGAVSAADFLLARASRIYPLWWLFMGMMAMYFLIAHGVPGDPEHFERSGNSVSVYLINSALLLPQAGHPSLGVGWTLIHEMYFYVVFAAFLFAPQKWLPGLLAAWAVFVISCDLAGWTNYFPTNLFELANYPMTMEFIAGAFVALLVMSGRRAFALPLTLIGGLGFVGAMLVFSNDDATYTLHWGRVVWFGIPSTILIYGITCLEAGGGLNRDRWSERWQSVSSRAWAGLVKLGDISFALYLSHILTISAVRRGLEFVAGGLESIGAPVMICNMFRLGAPGPTDNLLFVTASILAALVIAMLSYRFFERPSLAILARWRRKIVRPVSAPKRGEMMRAAVW